DAPTNSALTWRPAATLPACPQPQLILIVGRRSSWPATLRRTTALSPPPHRPLPFLLPAPQNRGHPFFRPWPRKKVRQDGSSANQSNSQSQSHWDQTCPPVSQ